MNPARWETSLAQYAGVRWLAVLLILTIGQSALAQKINLAASGNRECAACHLDWVDSFNKPGAILLMDKPTKPAVDTEEDCLGCHDGGVADDRKTVWEQRGHATNVAPPAHIHVPAGLPLPEGKLACITCHTAHAHPDNESLSTTIFLRMPNDTGQLCQQCHTDQGRGPQHGSHPLGPMKLELPKELADAGARAGSDNKTLTCQSCHRPHGASQDHLLVMGTQSSELCLSCHGRIRPEMWQKDVAHAHPLNPPLATAAQRQAISDMGTYVGPNNTMICLSCHKLHKGEPGQHLLADTVADSKICLRCHEDRKTIAGSQHDLRLTAPREKNARGETVAQSGPCGACHTFHTYTRQPVSTAADPDGVCMTCHAAGKVAAKAGGTSFGHPVTLSSRDLPAKVPLKLNPGPGHAESKTLECLTCHNPHETKQPKFLRSRDDLCGTCHVNQKKNLASGHDFSRLPGVLNGLGKSVAETGKCGFCHDVHHGTGPVLWSATNAAPASPDELCTQCHRAGGLGAKSSAFAFSHPTGPKAAPTAPQTIGLPLFDRAAGRSATGFVACASCHDPHANQQQSKSLLRVTSSTTNLCLQCHADKQSMVRGPHDQAVAVKAWPIGTKSPPATNLPAKDTCLGCHRPHSNDPANRLWAVTPVPGNNANDGVCIACHSERHWSVAGEISAGNMIHPRQFQPGTAIASAATASGLPLICTPLALAPAGGRQQVPEVLGPPSPFVRISPAGGDASPQGAVNTLACKTCHDPHVAAGSLHLLRVAPGGAPEDLCLKCHRDVAPLALSLHRLDTPAMDALVPVPAKVENADVADVAVEKSVLGPTPPRSLFGPVCSPCHAVHAIPGSDRRFLWAAPRNLSGSTEADQRCLGCHGPGGAAKRPDIFKHPEAAFASLKYATTQPAAQSAAALFSCSTCHLPHGKKIDGLGEVARGGEGDQVIRAARSLVRDDVSQTVCATCHGADARRVFLYYHQPDKRAAAREMSMPP